MEALLEVAALQAVHGQDAIALADSALQQLEEAAETQLSQHTLDVALRTSSGPVTLDLRVRLPPGYPTPTGDTTAAASATASVGPAPRPACSVCASLGVGSTGGGEGGAGDAAARKALGREWADQLASQLSALAGEALAEGRTCLHELLEALEAAAAGAAERAAAARAEAEAEAGAAGGRGQRAAEADDGALEVLLIRIDHMHNPGMYGRTIAGWAKELGLTGRLIRQGPLILLLLEGPRGALREYVCKERMMDVIGQQAPERGAAGGQGGGQAAERLRAFPDYRRAVTAGEVQADSLEGVGRLLAAAGVGQWLRPAAGLPP
ncbi:hypothetical protein HYH03_010622 [Edaphochlamys debaryana]|uniref:RWD domain-containing protein 3 n=1 Tax=Edaphochlamys debaryana TaxID=47281 RepID=A0A836BW02_9CHLO|nr:hypothetical protein HYH03_010622 [Edaphochlamys debaryana]|eukprot:KAG2490945.1 hypothetical protein HYH03_010622 [Edaphochlamys debaryana]